MAKMVPACDKTTGNKLPTLVPKIWLDNGTFPNLTGTEPRPKAPSPANVRDTQKEA